MEVCNVNSCKNLSIGCCICGYSYCFKHMTDHINNSQDIDLHKYRITNQKYIDKNIDEIRNRQNAYKNLKLQYIRQCNSLISRINDIYCKTIELIDSKIIECDNFLKTFAQCDKHSYINIEYFSEDYCYTYSFISQNIDFSMIDDFLQENFIDSIRINEEKKINYSYLSISRIEEILQEDGLFFRNHSGLVSSLAIANQKKLYFTGGYDKNIKM